MRNTCAHVDRDGLRIALTGGEAGAHINTHQELCDMVIERNSDGSLIVPVPSERHHESEGGADASSGSEDVAAPKTRVLHPGEGGYDEALAEWDLQHNPDREPAVSTATGRAEAMKVVHELAVSPNHAVKSALSSVSDPEASGEALRHVLIGGVHSVEAFSQEVTDTEGGEAIPAHKMTKIIGEVLAELDE
ncbi:MAG: hypothetical protein ACRDVC_11250 [Acidimicrobiales bacterium]